MGFEEKFIDRNIAQLCEMYDKIKGANTNLARIAPDLIDGLKPVQRRALYIMSLKDQGKTYRKLATISGDTFGRIHPHAPTAIEDSLVGLAQPWNNNIPLVDGEGNWGSCHDEETEVLTKVGWKYFKDITYNDELATVNPEKLGVIYFERPVNIIKYHYTGNIIKCKEDLSNASFAVTPDHKMFIKRPGVTRPYREFARDYFKVDAGNIKFGDGIPIFSLRANSDGNKIISEFSVIFDDILTSEEYDGYVYCAEVPTYHTLITRYNGCILLSGNCSGDPAGASRYIKARLSEYARACFFDDWKESVVDMVLGYDEETDEPLYLPAKYPNVLLNGCLGIGYGMSSNIPAFNFREVIEACILLMKNPDAKIVLIPDSPTGADIIESDFVKLCETGGGTYAMRCKYEIDAENNIIRITNLPYQITANIIRERIADIKEKNGLPELINMNDMSGKVVDIRLVIRDDINPYKFMKKLIGMVGGLEKSYPVNITVTNDYKSYDYSIHRLLLEWIKWRREQKRVVVSHKRTTLLAEQRTNDVKIFLMNKNNLEDTIRIFRTSRTRQEIESRLIEKYKHSEIKMDSLQARVLSNLRLIDLSINSYEACIKRRSELEKEIMEVEELLNTENGIDKVIIAELRDGIKRFGKPRRSNVVPYKLSIHSEIDESCILQLTSEGNITRKIATNVYEEPIPVDTNGFAVRVDNNSSFILIDENGYYSFIKVKDIPLDVEVPVNRYSKQKLTGNIIAALPYDIDSDRCCTLISKQGVIKRIRISDIGPSRKPCISLSKGDKLVRGIVTMIRSKKDLLVYTRNGMGQRLDPNNIKITSVMAKGSNGFKLIDDDEIVGCYSINPAENAYLLYTTVKAKQRLNNIEYLPIRSSKHDSMVKLISLSDRDKLFSVIGCNKLDKASIFFADGTNEIIDISKIRESTMSELPKKMVKKDMVSSSSNVVKVKLN